MEKAQVLFNCVRIDLDDALTADVSLVESHPHLHLHLKWIRQTLAYIREINEVLL